MRCGVSVTRFFVSHARTHGLSSPNYFQLVSLLDALVSSHIEKIGYTYDKVSELTISHVIQCLRDSAPDATATLDYDKKISFVGNLINRTCNRIPETRVDGVKMQKAIITILTAMTSGIKNNMERFHRYIQLWTQGLHGHKTLTEGSHISLWVNFQD